MLSLQSNSNRSLSIALCNEGNAVSRLAFCGTTQIRFRPNYHVKLLHLKTKDTDRCQLSFTIRSSLGDEYRSSRNIAISLFKRYRHYVDRGGIDNLKEFIAAGVNAYSLGCTDEGLRKELVNLKVSEVQGKETQKHGGITSLKSKTFCEEVEECILWLSIIFISILCTPQPTIVRWSTTPPISDEIKLQWEGFCSLIANAYFMKGMAWLPVKTLQLEQMAVMGNAEPPSVVASRMQLVFSTLEVVSPQWPKT